MTLSDCGFVVVEEFRMRHSRPTSKFENRAPYYAVCDWICCEQSAEQ